MKSHLRNVVGVVLTILLLLWVLRDVSPAEVARELAAADLTLLALSVLITIGGFAVRAVRWGVLLTPVERSIPFRPRYASVMIGFAANNLLPARIGELARALSLSRIAPVSVGASLATLVVERVFDGLVLVGLLFLVVATPGFPLTESVAGVDPRAAARVVALIMGAIGLVLVLLVLAPRRSIGVIEAILNRLLPVRLAQPVVRALESFLAGLAVLRSVRLLLVSALLALGQWLFTALSYWVGMLAFGIDHVPISGAIFLQSLISLAVAIPSSPGFFGPFEAAARVGLVLWGVPAQTAVSYAIGYHIAGFIPVTVIGIYYVWRYGLSWTDVRQSEERVDDMTTGSGGASATVEEGR